MSCIRRKTRSAMRFCCRVYSSCGSKPNGRRFDLSRGRRRVPHDVRGKPKCQIKMTLRSTRPNSNDP
eukprot:3936332-Lingulodinium_polyedra.AAC.1